VRQIGVSNWREEDVVALEAASRDHGAVAEELRRRVRRAVKDMAPVAARRRGLWIWLSETTDGGAGERFAQARRLLAALAGLAMILSGIGVVVGVERAGGGQIHVVWLLVLTLGLPWLLFLVGLGGWVWAGRSGVRGLLGGMLAAALRRWSGAGKWWDESAELRRVIAASVVRLGQGMGVAFQAGAILGLIGLVWFRHVGFYWESTTESAMGEALVWITSVLSMPWGHWGPQAVVDRDWIEMTRRIPGTLMIVESGPWWKFLVMSLLCWGFLPRLVFWWLSGWRERRVIAGLEFQSPACRRLWRDLTAVKRGDEPGGPTDGALVLDLGGMEPDHERLRPFLLRRVRVNPVGWATLGVLDEGKQEKAAQALAEAPAGVVLLAEGWSLSVPELTAALDKVRVAAGMEARVVVVVGNPGADGGMQSPSDEEQKQWEAAVDAIGDPMVEVIGYEEVSA